MKRWFHYDDSHVHALSGFEAVARNCQRDGYLFFYVNDAISVDGPPVAAAAATTSLKAAAPAAVHGS